MCDMIDLYQNELIYQPQIKIIDTTQRKILIQQRSELNTEYQEMRKAEKEIEFAQE